MGCGLGIIQSVAADVYKKEDEERETVDTASSVVDVDTKEIEGGDEKDSRQVE